MIRSEQLVDGHYFNLIRGDAKDPGLKKLERESCGRIYPKLADIQWSHADGYVRRQESSRLKWIKKAAYVWHADLPSPDAVPNLETPTRWSMRARQVKHRL